MEIPGATIILGIRSSMGFILPRTPMMVPTVENDSITCYKETTTSCSGQRCEKKKKKQCSWSGHTISFHS